MSPRPARSDAALPHALDPVAPEPDEPASPTVAAASSVGTLADLPVAGLTRRRMGLLLGALVAAWIIVLFARQVSEASEATARAESMRISNEAMTAKVAALEKELELIRRQAYIEQQARTYRLGSPQEIPFRLADDAPELPADAPGMPAVRLGEVTDRQTPLDAWLDLLFGPGDGDRDGAGGG